MLNDYNAIHEPYSKSHIKPDKQDSILPTILKISGPLSGRTIIDIGCGDGFFAHYFSLEAKMVYGVDNSKEQINEAKRNKSQNEEFIFGDMLNLEYPPSDIINVPFVLGYLESIVELKSLFKKFYDSLKDNGKIVGVVDNPLGLVHDNKEYGSIKRIKGSELKEGAKMDIELFNNEKKIITLHAYYHTKATIEKALRDAGFSNIVWHQPIVSKKGVESKGKKYWENYLKNCDLAYFTAKK